ncbi:MAG: hypothetical protein AAB652_02190 [Patescibacteria group bacterium]
MPYYRVRTQDPHVLDGDIAYDVNWRNLPPAADDKEAEHSVDEYVQEQKPVTLPSGKVYAKPIELVRIVRQWQ